VRHDVNNTPAVAYARSQEIEVVRTRSDAAQIEMVLKCALSIGPVVRIELLRNDSGKLVELELMREGYRELKPELGAKRLILPRIPK
jgi:sulfate transport system ATP-binding protein